METDLRCCYNLKCSRYRIGVAIGRYCTVCAQEMRAFAEWVGRGNNAGDFDTPPTDYNRRQRKAMRNQRHKGDNHMGGIWLPGFNGDMEEYMSMHPTVGEGKSNGNGKALTVVHTTPKDWTCDAGQVNGCPIAKTMDVHIPVNMYDEWVMLAEEFDTEWLAYLMGHQSEDGTWIIDSYYFPKQVANGGHCNVVEGVEGKDECLPNTIGSVHSHVKMGAFFSGEDVAHFNHPVELVINARGDIKANVAIQLQCGHPSRSEAKVFTLGERPPKEEHPQVVALKGKLTPQSITTTTSSTSSPTAQNWDSGTEQKYVRET
jgi:hypothetical protein